MVWHCPLTLLPSATWLLVLSVTAIACIEFISAGFEYAAFLVLPLSRYPRYLRGDTLLRDRRENDWGEYGHKGGSRLRTR